MSESAVVTEFVEELHRQPGAGLLRPPAPEGRLDAVAAEIGAQVSGVLRDLYARHDGSDVGSMERGYERFYVFPPGWEWMPLDGIAGSTREVMYWCGVADISGFPFAVDGSGTCLVADSDGERLWHGDYVEPPHPAWPDGTIVGLLEATTAAFQGRSNEFRFGPTKYGMTWID